MNLGGSLVSAILKIMVTAATLALVYFLILRPILDTTESISRDSNSRIERSMNLVNDAFSTSNQGNVKVQKQITGELKTTRLKANSPVFKCINRANQNVTRIERCARKYNLIP